MISMSSRLFGGREPAARIIPAPPASAMRCSSMMDRS
jgi:hypothetical protein